MAQWLTQLGLMTCAVLFIAGCDDSDLSDVHTRAAENEQAQNIPKANRQVVVRDEIQGFGLLPDMTVGETCNEEGCEKTIPKERYIQQGTIDPRLLTPDYAATRMEQRRATALNQDTAITALSAQEACERGDDSLSVSLNLSYLPFDFTRLQRFRSEDPQYRAIIDQRKEQVSGAQEKVIPLIESFNATIVDRSDLINTVEVQVDPCQLPNLLDITDVKGIELLGKSAPDANGHEQRAALGQDGTNWIPLTAGYGGLRGSTTSRVKYAVIESDSTINRNHLSFLDGPVGSVNRITDTFVCKQIWPLARKCSSSSAAESSASSHGTRVTGALLSDYLSGQVPSFNATTRENYTRIARKSTANFYRAYNNKSANIRTAIEHAIDIGEVDIINVSASPTGSETFCQNNSYSSVREAFWMAADAGVLPVISGGNTGKESGCNASGYAANPVTMAIGGTTSSDSLTDLDSNTRHPESSFGSRSVQLAGGRSVFTRYIDLVVNYCHHNLADTDSKGTSDKCGTSYSAPTVAGVAGLFLHWVSRRGGMNDLERDPYVIRAMLAMMGDGRTSVSGSNGYSLDSGYGFGNLRFVQLYFSGATNTSNAYWTMRRRNLVQGDIVEYPIHSVSLSNTNGWKMAAFIKDHFVEDSPDVAYQLVDTCAPGGTVVRRTAATYPLEARIRVRKNEVASLLQGCPAIRVTVHHANDVVKLYLADYVYKDDRKMHAAD